MTLYLLRSGPAVRITCVICAADYVLKRVRLAKQTRWQRNSTMQERDLVRHPPPAWVIAWKPGHSYQQHSSCHKLCRTHHEARQAQQLPQPVQDSQLMAQLEAQCLGCALPQWLLPTLRVHAGSALTSSAMLLLLLLQATSLRHPFIVPCVESWVVQNHTVNMIYAFCQNGDLASYLQRIRKQVCCWLLRCTQMPSISQNCSG